MDYDIKMIIDDSWSTLGTAFKVSIQVSVIAAQWWYHHYYDSIKLRYA